MKKRYIVLILIIIVIVFLGIRRAVNPLGNLPKGEFLATSTSEDGKYKINTYLCNGGATVDFAVRAEVVYKNKTRNIYWKYHEKNSNISWIDNDTVNINGVSIDLPNGYYNYKNDKKIK